jgi:outer membrane autotransporter protein
MSKYNFYSVFNHSIIAAFFVLQAGKIEASISTTNLSGNALTLASYLNEYAPSTTLDLFSGLSNQSLQSALNSVSPARNAYVTTTADQTLYSLSSLLTHHIDFLRFEYQDHSRNPLLAQLLVDASDKVHFAKPKSTPSFWVSGFGEYAHQQGGDQNQPFHAVSEAALIGLDYNFKQTEVIGFNLGYLHTEIKENHFVGNANTNCYFVSVYGGFSAGNFYLSPAVWGTFNQTKNIRNIAFTDYFEKTSSHRIAWQVMPHLEIGYDFKFSRGSITHFTLVDWVFAFQSSYQEKGSAAFDARSDKQSTSMLRSETGVKLNQKWATSWGAFLLKEKFSYVFQTPFGTENVITALPGISPEFTVTAVSQNLNLVTAGIDFGFILGQVYPGSIHLTFDGELGSSYWSADCAIRVTKEF